MDNVHIVMFLKKTVLCHFEIMALHFPFSVMLKLKKFHSIYFTVNIRLFDVFLSLSTEGLVIAVQFEVHFHFTNLMEAVNFRQTELIQSGSREQMR